MLKECALTVVILAFGAAPRLLAKPVSAGQHDGWSSPGTTAGGLRLRIQPEKRRVRQGHPILIDSVITNITGHAVVAGETGDMSLMFHPVVVKAPDGRPAARTRWWSSFDRQTPAGLHVVTEPLRPHQSLNCAKDRAYPLSRNFDMTLPGKYKIRFYYYGINGPKSNWTTVSVVPPPVLAPGGSALSPTRRVGLAWHRGGQHLELVIIAAGQDGSVPALRAYLRISGENTAGIRFTGRPRIDFGAIQVRGPVGYRGLQLVRKPKPHWIQAGQSVPFTAYGSWLAKQPPNGLKWKTYMLRPGIVYRYVEPINLSRMYDMSLSGVYRVRVELAHTHIWSPWEKVVVP